MHITSTKQCQTYTALAGADYINTGAGAFYDGHRLVLQFRNGFTVPSTLYGWTTAPTTATEDETRI